MSRRDPSPQRIADQVIDDLRRLVPDPDFVVPDVVGVVEGWRAWAVDGRDRLMPRMYSVTQSQYYWAPRKQAQAQCLRGRVNDLCKGQPPPREACTCGFYSAKSLTHLQGMGYNGYNADANGRFKIIGRVANWGTVIEGKQGWRSQFSYPLELFVPFEAWRLMEPLTRLYGVPASLMNHLSTTEEQA